LALMGWLLLLGAIATEVAGTMALRALSAGWRLVPAVVVTVGYLASFVLLALALRTVAVSTAYAVWSGVGTVGVAILGVLIYGERITLLCAAGIALVIAGCVLLNVGGAAHG
jgi:small multidrug resistance pump